MEDLFITHGDIFLLIGAYLIGSIPFGLLFSWIFGLKDPRKTGSNSIGATNILRSGNKVAAFLTFFFDALKGSIAVLLVLNLNQSFTYLASFCVVLGHIFPIWLGFRGGKGIATIFGVILVLSWPLAIACLVTWFVIALTTRYSSLASLISVLLSPLYAVLLGRNDLILTCLIFVLIIFWTHRENIARLMTERETKIGQSTSSKS